jgi:hypothetical protein
MGKLRMVIDSLRYEDLDLRRDLKYNRHTFLGN